MDSKDFVREHKNLVKILTTGSAIERMNEAKKQNQELKEFLSKNINTQNLIFDNVEVETDKFLTKLQTFKNLQWLEISRCELTQYDLYNFVKILLYSKNLKYLTLINNKIWEGFRTYIFTRNNNNKIHIDNILYKIYVLKENNSWSMFFIKENNETLIKRFEINIVDNNIEGKYGDFLNLNNDFAKYVKFLVE